MENSHTLPADVAFWSGLGTLTGVGSYLAAATPFWATVGIHAAGFLALGMAIRARYARRSR